MHVYTTIDRLPSRLRVVVVHVQRGLLIHILLVHVQHTVAGHFLAVSCFQAAKLRTSLVMDSCAADLRVGPLNCLLGTLFCFLFFFVQCV